MEENIQLFVCLLEGKVICGGLFILCDGIVQYHLSGTLGEFLELAPMKLLLDTVRLWANERKGRVLHLGGGVGAQEDSLFEFKAGFSDRRHEFAVWRWMLLPKIYDQLCQERRRWNSRNGFNSVATDYFPAYRCSTASTSAAIE
jgi:lipid II:glycine glycyltransferase (peptidoglycan interpeptide bridge formation enzyme)